MAKVVVTLVVLGAAVAVGVRLLHGHEEPIIAGSWRELRPPDFA